MHQHFHYHPFTPTLDPRLIFAPFHPHPKAPKLMRGWRDQKGLKVEIAHREKQNKISLISNRTMFPYAMRHINTQLAKLRDNETSSTHRHKINEQPREGLRFQNLVLARQRGSEHRSLTTLDIRTSKEKRRENDQWREKVRFLFIWHMIKTPTLNQPTTDFIVVLKCATNREADGQTKALVTVWQTLSFQSAEDCLRGITVSSCSPNFIWKSHCLFFAVCLCRSSQLFRLHNTCRPRHDVTYHASYGYVSAIQSKCHKDRVVYNDVSMRPRSLY